MSHPSSFTLIARLSVLIFGFAVILLLIGAGLFAAPPALSTGLLLLFAVGFWIPRILYLIRKRRAGRVILKTPVKRHAAAEIGSSITVIIAGVMFVARLVPVWPDFVLYLGILMISVGLGELFSAFFTTLITENGLLYVDGGFDAWTAIQSYRRTYGGNWIVLTVRRAGRTRQKELWIPERFREQFIAQLSRYVPESKTELSRAAA